MTPTPTPTPELPFDDVKPGDWFYNDVVYVYEKGIMDGVDNRVFSPNTTLNRAMFVTMLYRVAASPLSVRPRTSPTCPETPGSPTLWLGPALRA